MAKAGGSVSSGAATRLGKRDRLLKWLTLVVIDVGVVGSTALALAGGDSSFGPALSC